MFVFLFKHMFVYLLTVTYVFINFSGIFSAYIYRGVSHQLTKFQFTVGLGD